MGSGREKGHAVNGATPFRLSIKACLSEEQAVYPAAETFLARPVFLSPFRHFATQSVPPRRIVVEISPSTNYPGKSQLVLSPDFVSEDRSHTGARWSGEHTTPFPPHSARLRGRSPAVGYLC
jgi:hypothetical protein